MPKISDRMLYRLISNFDRVLLRAEHIDKDKDWLALYGDMLIANQLLLNLFSKEELKAYEMANRSDGNNDGMLHRR